MLIIKTGRPLRKVFLKGQLDPQASPEEFHEVDLAGGASQFEELPPKDPLDNERLKPLVREKIEQARAEWEQDSRQACLEAFEKGRAEGSAKAREEVSELVKRLNSMIAAVTEARENLLREGEQFIVDLAIQIARRFVNAEAVFKNELIKETIKSAVKMITEKEKVTVRVNPEDLEEVREHQDDIIFIGDGIGRLDVRADKNIERGGCVIETAAGNIDARLETRFAELEKALHEVYQQKSQVSPGAESAVDDETTEAEAERPAQTLELTDTEAGEHTDPGVTEQGDAGERDDSAE